MSGGSVPKNLVSFFTLEGLERAGSSESLINGWDCDLTIAILVWVLNAAISPLMFSISCEYLIVVSFGYSENRFSAYFTLFPIPYIFLLLDLTRRYLDMKIFRYKNWTNLYRNIDLILIKNWIKYEKNFFSTKITAIKDLLTSFSSSLTIRSILNINETLSHLYH